MTLRERTEGEKRAYAQGFEAGSRVAMSHFENEFKAIKEKMATHIEGINRTITAMHGEGEDE